jgi:PQQ-dependent catabolism-associated beta-propeller protein
MNDFQHRHSRDKDTEVKTKTCAPISPIPIRGRAIAYDVHTPSLAASRPSLPQAGETKSSGFSTILHLSRLREGKRGTRRGGPVTPYAITLPTKGREKKSEYILSSIRWLNVWILAFAGMTMLGVCSTSAHAHDVYVTNEKDNTITVFDSNTFEIKKTIAVGKRPRGLTFSKDHKLLYICASDSNAVQIMDVATGKIIDELPSGEDPEQFALSSDNRTLFIANEDNAVTTVVDTVEKKVIAQIDVGVEPEGMAVSHDGKLHVTTSETSNMVHWIDTSTLKQTATTLVSQRPRAAEFSPDDKLLWTTTEVGGRVHVIDTATKQQVTEIKFKIKGVARDKIQPVGVRLTRDGKYAFVALGPANHVAVIDAKTYDVLKYIVVGKRVWQLAFTPEQDKLFTTNGVSGDVTVIDIATLEAVQSVKVGRYPWGVDVLPTQ